MTAKGPPIRRWWILAGVVVLPLLLVADALLYYPALLQSGTLPIDGDSIGIPIGQNVFAAIILVPALLIFALPGLWLYRDKAGWLEYDLSHPWRLFLSTLLYALPALIMIIERTLALAEERPPYENYDLIFVFPLIIWLLMLRAAMAGPRETVSD